MTAETTREPEAIAKARAHVAKFTYMFDDHSADGSCVFLSENGEHFRVSHLLAAYDALRARLADAERERDDAVKSESYKDKLMRDFEAEADAMRPVVQAARAWWQGNRPVGWTEEKHADYPCINSPNADADDLCDAIGEYVRALDAGGAG